MFVTITSIRLRSAWNFFRLSWHGLQITRQMRALPGFIAIKNTGFWLDHYTMSAWHSQEALQTFAREGAHKNAMKESRKLATEVRTCTYEADALPDWKHARQLLSAQGRSFRFDS